MKNFRKPYLSIIMVSILLFVSCNKDSEFLIPSVENGIITNTKLKNQKSQGIEFTVKEHIKLVKQLSNLYKKQDKHIYDLKDLGQKNYKNKKDFKEFLKKNQFKHVDKIVVLSEKISNNISNYLSTNNLHEKADELEAVTIITKEIKKQEKSNKFLSRVDPCEEALNEAGANCSENYNISMAAVVISGFITFGWGTIIGYAAANVIMIKCFDDASAAYRNCMENMNI